MVEQIQSNGLNEVIDLQEDLSRGEVGKLVLLFSKYPKYKSVVAMASAGLPVSKAMVITGSGSMAEDRCQGILTNWDVERTIIRTDRIGGTVNSPSVQGVKIEDVWTTSKNLLNEGLLPMVIAQGDIFHNNYSVNILVDPKNPDSVYLEIVGPGFSATDINRRRIVNERGELAGGRGRFILRSNSVVSQRDYNEQVELLKENLIKREEKKRSAPFPNIEEADRWVNDFLEQEEALILQHPSYDPIPSKYLKRVWDFVPQMLLAGKNLRLGDNPFIVSMSFVQEDEKDNPYFWDIHPYSGYRKTEAGHPKEGIEGMKWRYFNREGD